jgi:hypothetical protein
MKNAFFLVCLLFALTGYSQTTNEMLNAHRFIPRDEDAAMTKGSRYLFDTSWAKGTLVSANDTEIRNDSFYFNFDKISQNIFFTQDLKNVFELDKKEYKSFVLRWHDSVYAFEHVFAINNSDFFQVLVKTPDKYSLYKFIHTQIKKANYTNNGISESGNKYDEYMDVPEYFIVFPNMEFRNFNSLKKNSIIKVFSLSADKDKVNGFYSGHSRGSGEGDLKELIRFLNL